MLTSCDTSVAHWEIGVHFKWCLQTNKKCYVILKDNVHNKRVRMLCYSCALIQCFHYVVLFASSFLEEKQNEKEGKKRQEKIVCGSRI